MLLLEFVFEGWDKETESFNCKESSGFELVS
jgi:hypothetical protein